MSNVNVVFFGFVYTANIPAHKRFSKNRLNIRAKMYLVISILEGHIKDSAVPPVF